MKSAQFFAMLALCTLMLGCHAQQQSTLPGELVGVWKTTAPKYADRYFELKSDTIVFGTGGRTRSMHAIDSIEQTREGHLTLYTIFYTEDGARSQWSFYYDPARGQSIRLRNQTDIVWTKKGDG